MTDQQLAGAVRQALLGLVDAIERWMNTQWPGVVKIRTGELRDAYKARRNLW